MGPDRLFGPMSISASGMAAERLRMEVIANNIANAQTTRTPGGGPFRRQDVVFAAMPGISESSGSGRSGSLGGVKAVEVVDDPSPPVSVLIPGHPDADSTGHVMMPDVKLPYEMANLMTAMRAYEANLKAAQAYRQVSEQALAILRGS
jgi:flagellar basal-body rod protein FlgC